MQNILRWYVTTFLSAGWNLGAWLDRVHQIWMGIGGWSGLVTRIGLFLLAWTVFWVCVFWWDEKRFLDDPKDAVEQAPLALEPVEEQPTLPLALAEITIPTTPLRARKGQFPIQGVIDAAITELSLLEEEQEKRGEK